MTNDPKTAPNAPASDAANQSGKAPDVKPAAATAPAPAVTPVEPKKV